MRFVEDAYRNEEHAALDVLAGCQVVFDVGLFQFDLTVLSIAADGMFQLQLRPEAQPVGELVAEKQDKTGEIDLLLAPVVCVQIFVVQLAVATNLSSFCPARGGGGRLLALLGDFHRCLGFFFGRFHVLFQRLDLALLFLDDAPHLFLAGHFSSNGQGTVGQQGGAQADTGAACTCHDSGLLIRA